MPDFDVMVCRTGIGFKTLRIRDCANAKEAAERAEAEAPNHVFSEKDSIYEVENCTELRQMSTYEPEQFEFAFVT